MNTFANAALNLPESPYARELGKGAGRMTFPPELEREYCRFYLSERRSHVRSFNLIIGVLVLCALLGTLLTGHPADRWEPERLAGLSGAYLGLLWVAYSAFYERIYLRTAALTSVAISILGAVEIAHRVVAGQGELLALLTTYSIGLYFLAGILFQAAVKANIVLILAFGAALAALGQPVLTIVYLDGLLAATALIGGVAFRHQGIRFRRTFLERGLIAELAERDGLTGLKNRRAFDQHLKRVWQQSLRDRRSLAVLMLDVDHFKSFNDHYGHQAGDEALRSIAAVVDGFAQRPMDLAARYGGEELVLILFDASREYVGRIAEQVRLAVQDLGIAHAAGRKVVTISVGVALVHPTLERSPDGAVQLADEALYAAKAAGRNRIELFETEYQLLSTGSFRTRRR